MYRQLFSRPDLYVARCGHLDAAIVGRAIPGAPAFMRGLRAALVSDTHLRGCTTQADIDALIEKIAGMEPELLLLGGDYADRAEDAVRLVRALAVLRPALGSFAVIGNNDAEAWAGRLDALRELMASVGIKLLINDSVRLQRNGGTLWIAGVDECLYGNPRAEGLYPPEPQPNTYRLLLSHFPHPAHPVPDAMLSGHTHGGQFNLLGVTPFTVGFERFTRKRLSSMAVEGLHDVSGMKLFVSKGVGASRIQWRIGVRPEVNLLYFE